MKQTRSRVLTALASALLLTAPLAAAQSAPAAPANRTSSTQAQNAAARVPAEVYQKNRAAAFRIEQRDDNGELDGIGTGYFINKDGLALTAYHVVFGAKNLRARTLSGEVLPVKVVGYDDGNDIAVVQVEVKKDVPFLPLAAEAPKTGDAALAIGNGGGRFLRAEYGNLQRLSVEAGRADFPSGTFELDAQLVPGDSGGPIINAKGEAIGVVSYIQVGSASGQGARSSARGMQIISYAVPVSRESTLVAALTKGEKRDAPVIGIRGGTDLRDEAFVPTGLGPKPGVVFFEVTPGSPAAKAGLRPIETLQQPRSPNDYPKLRGDVILAVDGKSVRDFTDLLTQVRARKVGDTVTLTVQRGEETVQLKMTLEGRAQVQMNR
ncbi:S1C family serine protease [Deinococcus peraridilitoris]|uniref:S1C family serine protease n=1 Tax=Deinococcus peraridilitoris TaxID=432329 RepID=UPI00059E732B|nr:S1C family serine protease [Deinococcus peraridilitoris]